MREIAKELYRTLKMLHDNQAEYIRLNHLGLPHHNQDMQQALVALTLYEEQIEAEKRGLKSRHHSLRPMR